MPDPYFKNVGLQLRAKEIQNTTNILNSSLPYNNYSTFISSNRYGALSLIDNTVVFDNLVSYKLLPGKPITSENKNSDIINIGSTRAFTVELKFLLTTFNPNNCVLLDIYYSGNSCFSIRISPTGIINIHVQSFTTPTFSSSTPISLNTKYHLEMTRENNTYRLFLNGNLFASHTANINLSVPALGYVTVGGFDSVNRSSDASGYFDDLRITLDVARHTANFTPPLPNEYEEYSPYSLFKKNNKILKLLNNGKVLGINYQHHSLTNISIFNKLSYYNFQDICKTGNEVISGIASLDNIPGKYKVTLFDRNRKKQLQATISDNNGYFEFKYLEKNVNYFIICEDYESKLIRKNSVIRDFINL